MEVDRKKIEAMLKRGEISERQAELLRMDLREGTDSDITSSTPVVSSQNTPSKYFIGFAIFAIATISVWKLFSSKERHLPPESETKSVQTPFREELKPMKVYTASQKFVLPKIVEERADSQLVPSFKIYGNELKKLYNGYLDAHPGLAGKVTLKISIAPSGKVDRVKIVSTTIHDAALEAIILKSARKWIFGPARSQEMIDVTVPFEFTE